MIKIDINQINVELGKNDIEIGTVSRSDNKAEVILENKVNDITINLRFGTVESIDIVIDELQEARKYLVNR
ncbi:hypothetical protein [Clostridium gasigenes]|uniref:Uncharacterized protein n=1 Tax=Clostridium gasigenes TaxID=94869 RepID=A0A1H0N3Q2_9CLOT|nr:hypothetical protein [Clostridium gasigenes]SDO87283.1 hypothetical protein SAMN04488529_101677 [Clostridium gasigenes]